MCGLFVTDRKLFDYSLSFPRSGVGDSRCLNHDLWD